MSIKLLPLYCLFLPAITNWIGVTAQQNVTDDFGLRQGFWILKGVEAKEKEGYYLDTAKYMEGNYKDNRKEGLWTKYYTNSWSKRSEITYEHDIPNGPYRLYYKDGKLQEEGILVNGDNRDSIIKYWNNDSLRQVKRFDEEGREHGYVISYFPNGQIKKKYKSNHGVIVDTLVEYGSTNILRHFAVYDSLGNVLVDQRFSTSVIPHIGIHNKRPCLEKDIPDSLIEQRISVVRSNKLLADGIFEGRCLRFGRYYVYDGDGGLLSIQLWGNGEFVRDELED